MAIKRTLKYFFLSLIIQKNFLNRKVHQNFFEIELKKLNKKQVLSSNRFFRSLFLFDSENNRKILNDNWVGFLLEISR